MLIEFRKIQNHLVVSILEDVLMDNSRELYLEFDAALKSEKNDLGTISFNFSQVRFLDSSGIGALIKCTSRAKEIGIHVQVVNLNKTLFSVFRLSGLNNLLKTIPIEEFLEEYPEFESYLKQRED
jgi:anti-anti-sigma factor